MAAFIGIVGLPLLILNVALFVAGGVTVDNLKAALFYLCIYVAFFPAGLAIPLITGGLLADPVWMALSLVGYLAYGLWLTLMLKFRSVRVFRFLVGGLGLLVGWNVFWWLRVLRELGRNWSSP